jgi:hypothetical protein
VETVLVEGASGSELRISIWLLGLWELRQLPWLAQHAVDVSRELNRLLVVLASLACGNYPADEML